MASLTFDGTAIFGSDAKLNVQQQAPTREFFDRGFPGINGTFRLDMARRQRIITVSGFMFATYSSLSSQIGTIEGKMDGNPFTLVITLGAIADTFTNVFLERFQKGPSISGKGASALLAFTAIFVQVQNF